MSETTNDYLSDLAERIKASDAKLSAELADILAGRPYKKRAAPSETTPAADAVEKKAPAARKPRAKRTTPPKASV